MGGADGPAVGVGVWAGAWQSWSAADPLSHAGAPPAYTTLRLQADRGAARGLNSYIYVCVETTNIRVHDFSSYLLTHDVFRLTQITVFY